MRRFNRATPLLVAALLLLAVGGWALDASAASVTAVDGPVATIGESTANPSSSATPAESVVPCVVASLEPTASASAPSSASESASASASPFETAPASGCPAASPGTGLASAPAVPPAKEVLGFFLPSQLDDVRAHADLHVLTALAYFGISSNKNGGLHRTSGGAPDFRWTAWRGTRMTKLIDEAHAAGTKMIMTLTRFSWNHTEAVGTVKLLSRAHARQRLAGEAAAEVVSRGVDGINVDFEPIPDGQSAHFVDFVRRLRHELDVRQPGLELTVDTTGYIANYDVAGLTAPGAADALYIMAYHYTGSWSRRTGAVSPLHRSTYDVTDTVDAFLELTTPDKLMLGLPWYGNFWSTKKSGMNARTRPGSAEYGFPGSLPYSDAVAVAAAHGRLWDSIEQVPWTRWKSRACASCPLTWRQLYYEDAQSLAAKHELVMDRGLRGTGIWTLGFGGNGPELYDEMRETFGAH